MKPYYQSESGKLYHGDCLEVMKSFPDNHIDLTVTSPPYDNLRDYKGYSFDFKPIAKELYRVTKKGGVVVWVVGDATVNGSESGTSFKQALYFKECGFNLHDTMIYHAEKPPLTHNRYEQKFEYMFILSKGRPNIFNPIKVNNRYIGSMHNASRFREKDGILRKANTLSSSATKIKGNIWKYSIGYFGSSLDKEAFKHPAIFPEKLAQDHIISWSNEGDLIFDCFAGSGTTLKQAELLNRKWVGSEISEDYCKIIKNRIKPIVNQMRF